MATSKSPRAKRGVLRRFAILVLLWLLAPMVCFVPVAWGAWGTGGAICGATEEVSDTSITCTLTSAENAEAGNVLIVLGATDNVDTTDGVTTLHSSMTDSQGNTYTKACEFTNGQGAAAAGATISVWYSKLTTQLVATTDSITLNTSSAVTDKVINTLDEFTITSGNIVSVEGACQTLANDNADAGSQTISGLTSQEYLFVRGIATESNAALSMTATTNYTLLPNDGCNNTTGGGEASDMGACGEFRIFTGTGDTSDPTLVDTTNDNASVYVALKEAAPPAVTCPPTLLLLGVGCFIFVPASLSLGCGRRRKVTGAW